MVSVSLIALDTAVCQKVVEDLGLYTPKVFGTVTTIKRDVNGMELVKKIDSFVK